MMPSKKQNRVVVAIFAHPDDEAFGPSGTIAKLAKNHNVYVLCATRGEAGLPAEAQAKADGNLKNIGKVREKELRCSAQILGVKKVYFLGFVDGTLSNALYHLLAARIKQKLKLLKPQTIITFEPRGISGHIDHITVSLATTYVFYHLPFVKKLLYFCISEEERKSVKDYFIYFPPGYPKSQIDQVVDVADVWETKIQAMMCHKSQITDARRVLKIRQKFPKVEHFLELAK
ncbi:hypothetical protein A2W70_04745 [Candidatus Curtissbacteria bacterium RIFCSPLOWO2_02_41_11]|uniref:GlcNAc-PI de-N-acetylase n=4 Tax=Patescibacteria group TaxID=1783273 RepID=A0A1F5HRP1_9BACT|nr:MAG: hypothetical protein A2W70_04745 [Candidatus Curtissbacteria bacterium RIFCSPLOWO2_02_41_11]OHA92824.1 MAG: hypothetical protein A2W58_01720 [Candidatus Zambryskibacteria bacterium RIFCSPHIGHO2_02_38_10.5]